MLAGCEIIECHQPAVALLPQSTRTRKTIVEHVEYGTGGRMAHDGDNDLSPPHCAIAVGPVTLSFMQSRPVALKQAPVFNVANHLASAVHI